MYSLSLFVAPVLSFTAGDFIFRRVLSYCRFLYGSSEITRHLARYFFYVSARRAEALFPVLGLATLPRQPEL